MLTEIWTLLTLILFEIIFNIDNLIFISLLINNAPITIKKKLYFISIGLMLLTRFIVILMISYILTSIQKPILHITLLDISTKDLFMIVGGLFLIIKSSIELQNNIILYRQIEKKIDIKLQLFSIISQILLIDSIFSIDSLLTAIILTHNIIIITIAYTFSILIMIFLLNYITKLIESNSELKMIIIIFILFIGVYSTLEGFHIEIQKKYLLLIFLIFFTRNIKIKNLNLHNKIIYFVKTIALKLKINKNIKLLDIISFLLN
ncbi:MAG: TerC family protein [Wolbachia endosymbiont of Menacanthus eurysternus]|nr:MAG: TerC family protein [Wolbachia endosymbiont of Menacanthus eurysternus]